MLCTLLNGDRDTSTRLAKSINIARAPTKGHLGEDFVTRDLPKHCERTIRCTTCSARRQYVGGTVKGTYEEGRLCPTPDWAPPRRHLITKCSRLSHVDSCPFPPPAWLFDPRRVPSAQREDGLPQAGRLRQPAVAYNQVTLHRFNMSSIAQITIYSLLLTREPASRLGEARHRAPT